MAEEIPQWQAEPEPPPPQPAPQRRPRPAADPLAGLADELSRTPVPPPEQGNGDGRAVVRREPRMPRSQPPAAPPPAPPSVAPAADAQFNSPADQNLAEMAQRLEAALRRPGRSEDTRAGEPAPRMEPAPPEMVEDHPPQRGPARPVRSEKPAAGKSSLYDSLEQEMASLLGRPNNKP
jgi:hypothetical protein